MRRCCFKSRLLSGLHIFAGMNTAPGLAIRRVGPADLDTLRSFAEETFRVAWQHDNEPVAFEAYCQKSFAFETMRAELAEPDVEFYFAEADNKLIAYLKLCLHRLPSHWDGGNALQLERIYVSASVQSRGLGAALLAFAEARARATGAEWVWLSVWQKSPRSIAFYQRNGYEIFAVETFWVGDDPQPDWLMRKRIHLNSTTDMPV